MAGGTCARDEVSASARLVFLLRPSPVAIFVLGAVVTAAAVGISAKRASGAGDAQEEGLALPMDVPAYGFAKVVRVNGVAVLEATMRT